MKNGTTKNTITISHFHMAMLKIVFLLAFLTSGANAHGYLKTPRSRNIIAYQDGAGWGSDPNAYPKDYCPHCLNRGGVIGRCGNNGSQNYDTPKSTAGTIMPADPQIVASSGGQIIIDVGITAHHMGHFEFKICAVSSPAEAPSQECFDENTLNVVEDVFYGSLPDPSYPERAYMPPSNYPGFKYDTSAGLSATLYRYKLQLPNDVVGDLVLLQWRYLTANSCTFPGYDTYNFPSDWGNMGNNLSLCQDPLPADGNGVPEQFWNCAEMTITSGPVEPTTPPPIPGPTTPAPVSQAPAETPTEAPLFLAPPVPSPVDQQTPSPVDGSCDEGLKMAVNVGYYQSWAVWRNGCGVVQPEDIDVEGMGYTHLLYSFAAISSSYTLEAYNQAYEEEYPRMVRMNALKQTHPHLKTFIAVGGWSHNDPGQYCTRFSEVSATAARRETFANSVISFLRQYNFDGVDLDWEYPADLNRCGTGNDKANYALLVQAIRNRMDQEPEDFLITMAVPASRTRLGLGYDLPSLANSLDWINLMSYDIAGSWGTETGSQTDMRHIRDVVDYFGEQNYPSSKLVLGLAAYGRTFSLTDPNCLTVGCPFNGARGGGCPVWDEPGYTAYLTIQELIDSGAHKRHEFNPTTESMELVTNDNEFISFDNEMTFGIKADYADEQCMRGYMWWAVDMIADSFTIGPPTPPTAPTPTAPVPAPVPAPVSNTPCGNGNPGNGICADPSLCCSEWGWCGSMTEHCSGNPTPPPVPAPIPQPTLGPTQEPTLNPTSVPTKAPVPDSTSAPVSTSTPTLAPGGCGNIFSEGFENGWGKFKVGKNDAALDNATTKSGDWSVRLRDDSATSKIETSKPEKVSMYSELKIHFWFYADKAEDLHVDVKFNGQDWVTMANYTKDTDYYNEEWTDKTVTFPVLKNRVKIRFRSGTDGNKKKFYLDDIDFCGLVEGTPTEAPLYLAPPVPPPVSVPTLPPVEPQTSSPTDPPTLPPVNIETPPPTDPPTLSPVNIETPPPTDSPVNNPASPCCPASYTGLRAWSNCNQYYHCVNGDVTGGLLNVPDGTLFDQNLQNINWANQVTCVVDDC